VNKLQFYMIHLMPYPYIPPGEDLESTWITIPNTHFEPGVAQKLYTEYLDELIACEKLGYDGIIVNEHHQNAFGTICAPNVWAGYLAARTEHIRIGVIGNALPLHQNPLRVAEEIAMLDLISGGRIISGHVRGMGAEYHSSGVDPTTSKGRFWEAHDLILKAWTTDGPFAWQGEHYDIEHANIWPKPLQQPHPPIWLPGTGSTETIREVAKRRFAYMQTTTSNWITKKSFALFRQICEDEFGYTPAPTQLGRVIPTYVAETDEQARREFMPHAMWFFRTGLKIPMHHLMPPGYNSADAALRTVKGRAAAGVKNFWEMDYDELIDSGHIIVGSPQTVIDKYAQQQEEYGLGMAISAGGHLGSMPHWMVMKNQQIMAEEVMPHFREPDGKPDHLRVDRLGPVTAAEHAARVGKPALRPVVRITGADGRTRDLDAITGHVPEVAAAARGEGPAATNGSADGNGNGTAHGNGANGNGANGNGTAGGGDGAGDGHGVLVGGAQA
jgi:alkanesulfonate monooxygenase SsuD/methylene tetrahydromethanopterin reductase-like flavin-dependent oxidoreductase (luciferase family)